MTASSSESLRSSLEALQRENAELSRFALLGQALVGLAHELNNALNSIMLQTSVVQLRVDAQARQELAVIRQHAAQAAGLIRTLQHIVQERREQSYPVDLHSVLAEILEEETNLRSRVSVEREGESTASRPQIHSTRSAIKQLLRLVLKGVCAGTKAAVKAATQVREGSAVLSLTIADDEGDPLAVEDLPWRGLDDVGRLAGPTLLRQLGGVLTAEQGSDGVVIVRIAWAPMNRPAHPQR
jgi:signal transduction histidine kinase